MRTHTYIYIYIYIYVYIYIHTYIYIYIYRYAEHKFVTKQHDFYKNDKIGICINSEKEKNHPAH